MNRFPSDFLWGATDSVLQAELCDEVNFCHIHPQNIELMQKIGVRACRINLFWSRIFPNGDGKPDLKELDFYNRLIDELLQHGVTPWLSFFHGDLPLPLGQRLGGWQNKEIVNYFGDYVNFVTDKLSDRVTNFFSVNEIGSFAQVGKSVSSSDSPLVGRAFNQAIYNGCLAHGIAIRAVRKAARQPIQIGIADNPKIALPLDTAPENIDAARQAFRLENAAILSLIREGRYPTEYLEKLGSDAPDFTDEELKIIASPMDFQGINVDTAQQIIADENAPNGYKIISKTEDSLNSEAAYWGCRLLCELWPTSSIYISGCALVGQINDAKWIKCLRETLTSVQRLTAENYPVKGYFQQALVDCFEYSSDADRKSPLSPLNPSAEYYAKVIETNKVL